MRRVSEVVQVIWPQLLQLGLCHLLEVDANDQKVRRETRIPRRSKGKPQGGPLERSPGVLALGPRRLSGWLSGFWMGIRRREKTHVAGCSLSTVSELDF